ncbi:contactin-associated protein-like 5 [Oncorhynchus masou masou]|uniref:contactin-associated protein-like 5 n=1 Tax=Oncorhynchus masou masou TaxID=90313 RepID=UPI00318331BE
MSFESGSSVTLTFQMPFPVMHNRDRGSQSSSSQPIHSQSSSSQPIHSQSSSCQPIHSQSSAIYAHDGESRENVAFSFLTTNTPAMLLCVNTYHQQYLAIILANNGSLQIWYHLNREKRAEIFTPKVSSLADGQLHRVQVHREGKDLYVQVSDLYRCNGIQRKKVRTKMQRATCSFLLNRTEH